MIHMGEQRWFYRDSDDLTAIVERLKQIPCPHCKVVGMLIRHDSLSGLDESNSRQILRARRIFCSNRNARRGCGRTFSIWVADKIRHLSMTAGTLWRFLKAAVAGSIAAARRAANCQRSERTWQRLWKRFDLGQCRIRTALSARCPPPELPPQPSHRPAAAQVLAHLHTAFPDADPIAAFQHALRIFFV
jgi:hypothetical protein